MLRKIEGIRKRERPNARWIDSIKEAIEMNQQELSRADGGRAVSKSRIHRVPKNWSKLNGTKHTHTNVTY